jgi:hypothetical protein
MLIEYKDTKIAPNIVLIESTIELCHQYVIQDVIHFSLVLFRYLRFEFIVIIIQLLVIY